MCEMGEGRSSLMAAGGPAQISGKIGLLAALRGEVLPRLVGKSVQLVVGIFAMISLLAGCTTAQVHDVGETSGGIRPREAIAILTVTDSPLEGEAVGCISEAVRTAHPKARIIPPDEFRRTVFAARPPDDEAERAKYLTSLANEPAIRDRMDSLGIRFLMSVGGGTEQGGDLLVSPPAPIVLWVAHRRSTLAASILDLNQARQAGELHAEASGHPWFVLIYILPLGAPAFTEGRVCKDIGEAVVHYLKGEPTPGPSGTPERRDR